LIAPLRVFRDPYASRRPPPSGTEPTLLRERRVARGGAPPLACRRHPCPAPPVPPAHDASAVARQPAPCGCLEGENGAGYMNTGRVTPLAYDRRAQHACVEIDPPAQSRAPAAQGTGLRAAGFWTRHLGMTACAVCGRTRAGVQCEPRRGDRRAHGCGERVSGSAALRQEVGGGRGVAAAAAAEAAEAVVCGTTLRTGG
jgi:hypothetical protein